MPLAAGQLVVGRYRVIRSLGKGGFGAVYLVEDTRLAGRVLALKESFNNSPEATQQFTFEAQILATIRHAALPVVSDSFTDPAGHLFLIMDYVEGKDLSELVRQGAVPEPQAVTWMIEICQAVGFLHGQIPPIIHRDIKPSNIKIRANGHAMLVDFGIAKIYAPQKQTLSIAKAISSGYSPPEQYYGGTDTRSDVYSLGATLYCAVTAAVPPEATELLGGTAVLTPPRRLNARLSPGLEQIILRAMSLNSDKRYATGGELALVLEELAQGQPFPVELSGPASSPAPESMGRRCPTCGRINRPGAKFCPMDGTRLPSPADTGAPSTTGAASRHSSRPLITPQMHFELGNACARKRDYARAMAEYAEALQGGFEHVALYTNWANALIEMDRPEDAIPILQRGLGHYPQDADLYGQLGWAYSITGKPAEAAHVLERALALDPSPGTHFILGMVYQQLRDDVRAVGEIRQYLNAGPDSAAPHFMLAQSFFRMDRLAQAQVECQRALSMDPDHAGAYGLLAAVHVKRQRYPEAIQAAMQSNQRELNAPAYNSLAAAYIAQDKWSEAIDALKESARLNPQDPDPHLHMAGCYSHLNREAEAVAELERVLQIDPKNKVAREMLSEKRA